MSACKQKIGFIFLVLIYLVSSQCAYGEALNSQNICEPCIVSNCVYCTNSDISICQACVQPYILGQNGQTCECPTGFGSLDKGGCVLCSVSNCAKCSTPKQNVCELCQENFSSIKTQSGIQCICEAPFMLSEQNQCVCPPGLGFDYSSGCSICSVSNCQICGNSDDSTCLKCFGSAQLSADNSTCSCPLGQGPALGIGCASCRTQNCASCSNAVIERCDTCLPNFKKIVSQTRTICICQQPYELRADGSCECPSLSGPNGSGGCSLCQVDNCDSCQGSNYMKCSICTFPYVLSSNKTACTCPPGTFASTGGGCQKCSVQHCLSCDIPNQNSCNQCATNFINLVAGTTSQCLCKYPFYVNEEGQCTCLPGTVQSGVNQCQPCQVSKCSQCSSPDSTTCQKCSYSYVLSEDGNSCECPTGMAPLNGQNCAPCADSNCQSCDNSAIDVCQSCIGNFTIQIKSFNNVSNQVESNFCQCFKPFILDENGQCVCPPGKTYNLGLCQKCAVSNCQNCENSDISCSSCFAPFVLNGMGNQCVCKSGYVLENGTCNPCQITNCDVCDSSTVDTCNQCSTNFKLSTSTNSKTIQSGNQTETITMQTATCTCDSPFILNSNGQCVCPTGMFEDQESGCAACSISNCDVCSDANTCGICEETYILSNNQCQCPDSFGVSNEGICKPCALSNCIQCENSETLKCQSCAQNFTLITTQANGIQNQYCQCFAPYSISKQGQCMLICPPGTVQQNNSCVACKIYKCKQCSSSALYTCNQCTSPFVLAEDGKQCVCPVGQGPYQNSCSLCSDSRCALCPSNLGSCYECKPPYQLNSQGQCDCPRGSGVDRYGICSACLVQNCGQCQTSYAATCVNCIYPSVLNADKSKCTCPPGQALAPNGGCSPCAVHNCQQCSNSVEKTCIQCRPSFTLDKQAHECRCPPSQGKNNYGFCESCQVFNCIECYQSSYTCSICQAPFVSNSQGTACVCPLGEAPNGQGGCAKCQVPYCKSCPTSDEFLCNECLPAFQLGKNGTKCFWPDQNMDGCPMGHGLSQTQSCEFCSVPYCVKCYQSLATCSICQPPFVPNSNGSECICPKGMAPNGNAGGCSYCMVNDCQKCSNSVSNTCQACYYPFQLESKNTLCALPQKKKQTPFQKIIGDGKTAYKDYGAIGSLVSSLSSQLPDPQDELVDHFMLGFLWGILMVIALIGIGFLVYKCVNRRNNSNQGENSSQSFEVELPSSSTQVR